MFRAQAVRVSVLQAGTPDRGKTRSGEPGPHHGPATSRSRCPGGSRAAWARPAARRSVVVPERSQGEEPLGAAIQQPVQLNEASRAPTITKGLIKPLEERPRTRAPAPTRRNSPARPHLLTSAVAATYPEIKMESKNLKDELELAEKRLVSLRSGKRSPGSYGPPVSSGSGMKVAIDQQLKTIEDLKKRLAKSDKKGK